VRQHRINRIYIPCRWSQPRIKKLDDLRDTTASVYFVPDIFVFDLIQARFDQVNGIPVVAVCESPFYGLNSMLKRLSDIVLSSLVLLVIWPFMSLIALGIRLSSVGPVLFKQRRYGLNGEEIIVYKFRTMTVCEDGDRTYKQVTKNDSRVTPFGALLRATSLDELPQIFNVLIGQMSLVGPRPHAVAVNEQYRKLISGYMIRHKVKPGITGWAQVNGFRGGDSLDEMQGRVAHDSITFATGPSGWIC
jgi:putative colanic acid biosynthesis UDP-glucose lipid carrier transferase